MLTKFRDCLGTNSHGALEHYVFVTVKPKEQLWEIKAMNYIQIWRKEKKKKTTKSAFLTFITNLPSIEKIFCEIECIFIFFSLEKILTPLNIDISGQERTKIKLRY